jgi:hypothetical protein
VGTLFFIHIRKTGGTSVMHAAREHFGSERTLLVYGARSQWTSPAALKIMAATRDPRQRLALFANHIEQNDIAFFSSHISAAGLRGFHSARAFTILRNPVERVLSHYFFMRKKGRTDEPLEAFIERPEYWNEQTRALSGINLDALAVVGILERFGAFIDALNGRFALRLTAEHRKDGGLLKDIRAKLVGASVRRRIEALNAEDVALYEQAARLAAGAPGASTVGPLPVAVRPG